MKPSVRDFDDEIDAQYEEWCAEEEERDNQRQAAEQARYEQEIEDLRSEALAESEARAREAQEAAERERRDIELAAMRREAAAGNVREDLKHADVSTLSNADYASYRRMKRAKGTQPTSRATLADVAKRVVYRTQCDVPLDVERARARSSMTYALREREYRLAVIAAAKVEMAGSMRYSGPYLPAMGTGRDTVLVHTVRGRFDLATCLVEELEYVADVFCLDVGVPSPLSGSR